MPPALKRKSFFVNEVAIRRAKRILGASSDAEAVRTAVERVEETERFLAFLEQTKGKLPRGSFRV